MCVLGELWLTDQVFPADLEIFQVAENREGNLPGIEEGLGNPLDVVGRHRFDALHQFVERARFDIRLAVDSRLNMRDPFR